LPVLHHVVLKASFEREAGFFKHACGCGIIREHLCRDATERKIFEAEIRDRCDHFSHDATFPEVRAQPVTHCRSMSMHILPRVNADPANRGTVNLDAKNCRRLLNYFLLQEFMRVIDCVRIRKEVAQPEPNFSVVRVLRVLRE
jgi:hypothetical protein